ncbi:MAG: cell wall hydrolase [Clostridiaceae bacterium]|nr:cell wall hydrolase [Clostridiaceae bacterium]
MKKTIIILFVMCFFVVVLVPTQIVKAEFAPKIEATKLYKEKIEAVEVFQTTNTDIYVTEDEVYLMAQAVFAESRSESFEGKVAVAAVILNRVKNPNFPHTIEGVIKQKYAFSCVKNNKINVVPDESCYAAVLSALKGNDPTSKAVFYYNPKIATSTWMINVAKSNTKTIGNHVFFHTK